jgi:lipopolysaccharide biosynthesis glycosyltransferase
MSKNLVYYSVGFNDSYAELLKLSISKLDLYNTNQDILIITDKKFYEKNFKDYNRPNLYYHMVENLSGDDVAFNRLKIFDANISSYDNLMYLDTDVWANLNLSKIFESCEDNKLYAVVEDYSFENHFRTPFNLGLYCKDDVDFFEKNKIHTFNSGLMMFKNSQKMKYHFEDVLNLRILYPNGQFSDQPYINHYFNRHHLVDTTIIAPFKNFYYIVDENFNDDINLNGKFCHFIGDTFNGESKIKKIKKYKNKVMYNHRDDLIRDLNCLIPSGKGVEIGVFKGEFSKNILNNWGGTLYMVDVWRPLGDEYEDDSNHKNHIDAYQETMKNIKGYENKGIMVRATSEIAADMFQDESLDFIFIDANHAYDFVVEDISLWFPKLKKGGVFSGHDYINMDWYSDPNFAPNGKDKYIYTSRLDGTPIYNGVFGVNPAVDEFCDKHGYKPNVTKEWFGTWWFIK